MDDKPIIQCRNIHLSFKEKQVLDNINISISKGEIFGYWARQAQVKHLC